MGTHAIIMIREKTRTEGVYVHWDGYPSGCGKILLENYNTLEKVRELISLGDMSSLGERIAPNEGEKHSFEKPLDDVCVFYHRDRGERWEDVKPAVTYGKNKYPSFGEYSYLFDAEEGRWYYTSDRCGDISWKLLTVRDCR